jgi:hypothetical protein
LKLTFEEKIPNLISGTINKITTETDFKVSDNGSTVDIKGQFVVLREIKSESRVTEIRDFFPVDISVNKRKLIKKTGEVSLRLEGFRFDFEGDYTVFVVDLDLANVEDDQEEQHQEYEFTLEPTKYL